MSNSRSGMLDRLELLRMPFEQIRCVCISFDDTVSHSSNVLELNRAGVEGRRN
jgi:hypothetical protein